MGVVQATHAQGRPKAADNRLYLSGGDARRWRAARCCQHRGVDAVAAAGTAGVSTEGAGKGALAAEDEAPAEVALEDAGKGALAAEEEAASRGGGIAPTLGTGVVVH
eukprot:656393-Pleurochrysis_carterae.AAC.2